MSENSTPEVTFEQLQAELQNKESALNEVKKQFDAVLAKNQELLDETKKFKSRAREEAEAKIRAEEEKARKIGDYEQLFKSSEQARAEWQDKYKELENKISNEKINNTALKLAADLADGANAEILSEFIARRLKYTDDGIRVLDGNGGLTVSSLEDLKREFESSERYKSLIRGNKASGGGASGTNGGASKSTMQRASFDKLNPTQKMDFIKKGGTLIDN